MSAPIVPLADYVLVHAEEAEKKTASGILLADSGAEKPNIAVVLAVGKDVKAIKIDDRIIYGGYSNTEVKMNGKDYLLVKEENIYAKVK